METQPYLIVATLIFLIGAAGFMVRKNLIVLFMSVELMLNGANLSLVGFSREMAHMSNGAPEAGQVLVLMAMGVAAAEVAVGLSIVIAVFRHMRTVDVDAPRATALRD